MILGKKRLAVRWFSICLIILATVALAYLAISNGQAIQYMTWTYDTAGIYPDLFESIRDAADLHPYEGRSIYPPLTYLILWIFSKMVPGRLQCRLRIWRSICNAEWGSCRDDVLSSVNRRCLCHGSKQVVIERH